METDPGADPIPATPTHDESGVASAAPCSPFDLLMGQIEAMRDRARKYAEEDEAEENFEAAHRQRTVEGTLSELLRLGTHFKANAY